MTEPRSAQEIAAARAAHEKAHRDQRRFQAAVAAMAALIGCENTWTQEEIADTAVGAADALLERLGDS